MYEMIFFDAGFTLIQSRHSTLQTLIEVLAAQGLTPTEVDLQRAWDVADRWFWEEYQRPDNATWGSDERIHQTWQYHHGLMLKELNVDDADSRLADAIIHAYAQPENWMLYPEVHETLSQLRGEGYRLAIISDWSTRLYELTAALGLDELMEFSHVSGAVGLAKPDPRFYTSAAERAGIDPSRAVMVGDSYRADVTGARAAGMGAVLIDRPGTQQGKDVATIASLSELPELLRRGV